MQTFLPYKSFADSAKCLDNKRLGKQRVEVLQILNTLTGRSTGWSNHPAVKMWRGYERALCAYGLEVCAHWRWDRGFNDTCYEKIYRSVRIKYSSIFELANFYPPWLTDEFCLSHRSNLIRKDPNHYRPLWPDVPDNLPYIWPV